MQYDSLRQIPYDGTTFKTTTHNDGPAQYFRGELSKQVQSILSKEQYRKPDGTKYNSEWIDDKCADHSILF